LHAGEETEDHTELTLAERCGSPGSLAAGERVLRFLVVAEIVTLRAQASLSTQVWPFVSLHQGIGPKARRGKSLDDPTLAKTNRARASHTFILDLAECRSRSP
jgi:hypothetical protein